MVKVIAGILLFFGCTALGFSKASGYKNRRVELEDTLELQMFCKNAPKD